MRIAVIGAGAVGSALGSLLWRAGEDVVPGQVFSIHAFDVAQTEPAAAG